MNASRARQILVDDRFAGMRLDRFLAGELHGVAGDAEGLSRSEIQRLIGEGRITLNGARTKSSARIHPRDRIDVDAPPPRDSAVRAEALPLDILYEDGDCIVINKAAGVTVHPAAGHWSGTLVNALLHHCPNIDGIGGVRRPGIVHRLDKDTSGVMIVAKNAAAYQHFARQFKDRSVTKEYLAVVWGRMKPDRGIIDRPIGRHRSDRKKMSSVKSISRSREAATEWSVEERFTLSAGKTRAGEVTLVRLRPRTGRTHQIRVHLADIGHPIVGDRMYGGRRKPSLPESCGALANFPRQALHAEKLSIEPVGGGTRTNFSAPLPEDIIALLSLLRSELRNVSG